MLVIYLSLILMAMDLALACSPFATNFPPGSVASDSSNSEDSLLFTSSSPFIALSSPSSFMVNEGLTMFLRKPPGEVERQGGVNNQVGQGATINSTFTLLYGRVSFEVAIPTLVPGAVVAMILIGADEHDEVDVEIIEGDAFHWQSNVYAPSPADKQPLWGVFGKTHSLPSPSNTVRSAHTYTIDWSMDRIVWSVDGMAVRTLIPRQTYKNGYFHYPSHPTRLQLGIWDASSPLGTAQWAKGPIDWNNTSSDIHAVVKSVKVECPYS